MNMTMTQSMTMTIAQSLLAEFEQELKTTKKFLDRVPESKLNWKPHEKSMTAGELALHIAQVPAGVLAMAMQDEAAPPSTADRPQPANLREVLAALDHSAAFVRQRLAKIDDERMRDTFTIAQDGRTIMAMPRMAFLRAVMLNHWYQHRGQLGVYLRLLGAKVPSSYGPSGDEPFGG
jgi:uncharacterized damage-inducible protein DinB